MTGDRSPTPPLAVWAGPECTINRIGDRYLDQVERTGHDRRITDLDRFAALGVRTLRYPVLWERVAPEGLDRAQWAWTDSRLTRLRALGVRAIVGLLHHGSGPRGTSLVDDALPERLAAYAGAVARRYPWVDAYTPINEPLTTARFSGLYGHWYPHGRDDRTFARALLLQVKAVALAMAAIRAVNSDAILVQTEDLGFTRATPGLAYQAAFENERRWLTFELLLGRVTGDHPMAEYLIAIGAEPDQLAWFCDHPCPPDIVGLNYYATSERFLDGECDRAASCPGNGRDRYVDVEAVRACGLAGIATLLAQAWARLGCPIAVTEVHLGCTREEQMRWLLDVWDGAHAARAAGADLRAITVWSLLGAYDWDSLCTADRGRYEPGVFDVRGGQPRPTALAAMVRALAAGRRPDHPVLAAPGWWAR